MTVLCADVGLISTRRTTRVTESADVSPARLHIGVSLNGEWPLVNRFCSSGHLVNDDPTKTCPLPVWLCAGRGHGSSHRLTDSIAHSTDRQPLVSGQYFRPLFIWVHSLLVDLNSALVSGISSLKPLDAYWGLTSSEVMVMVCITTNPFFP